METVTLPSRVPSRKCGRISLALLKSATRIDLKNAADGNNAKYMLDSMQEIIDAYRHSRNASLAAIIDTACGQRHNIIPN